MIKNPLKYKRIIKLQSIYWVLSLVGFLFRRHSWSIGKIKVVKGFWILAVGFIFYVGFIFAVIHITVLSKISETFMHLSWDSINWKEIVIWKRLFTNRILFFKIHKWWSKIFLNHFGVMSVLLQDHSQESFGHNAVFGYVMSLVFVDKINYFTYFLFLIIKANIRLDLISISIKFFG